MTNETPSSNLVSDLREAQTSGRGNGGHRELCGLAANEIERLRNALQVFVDMEDISTYTNATHYWAAYAILTKKARALLPGEHS